MRPEAKQKTMPEDSGSFEERRERTWSAGVRFLMNRTVERCEFASGTKHPIRWVSEDLDPGLFNGQLSRTMASR
jgi:hypothetical protein